MIVAASRAITSRHSRERSPQNRREYASARISRQPAVGGVPRQRSHRRRAVDRPVRVRQPGWPLTLRAPTSQAGGFIGFPRSPCEFPLNARLSQVPQLIVRMKMLSSVTSSRSVVPTAARKTSCRPANAPHAINRSRPCARRFEPSLKKVTHA